MPRLVSGGPDQVVRTPYELEAKENLRLGTKMDQNALSVYGSPRPEPEGDVVLPRTAMTNSPVVPDISQVERDPGVRNEKRIIRSDSDTLLGEDIPEAMKGNYILNISQRLKRLKESK